MSLINYAGREINCKIVYYGTGLGGKTTNLEYVYSKVNPDAKGKMISLATETERTLFFDFLPIDLGDVKGFKTRFHGYDLTTLPFAMQYNKRDLPNAMSADDLRAQLNPMGVPDFEGVAIEGRGVFETLGAVSKMVVQALN